MVLRICNIPRRVTGRREATPCMAFHTAPLAAWTQRRVFHTSMRLARHFYNAKEQTVHSRQTRWLHVFAVAVYAAGVRQRAAVNGETPPVDGASCAVSRCAAVAGQMALTYPADVAEAAQWSRAHAQQKGDAAVQMLEDEPCSDRAWLVAFPQVIIMMGRSPTGCRIWAMRSWRNRRT